MHAARPQSGWAFVVVLIALAIAAFLARDFLSRMVDRSVTGARSDTPTQHSAHDPSPTPMVRAHTVGTTVQQQVDALSRRIDEGAR